MNCKKCLDLKMKTNDPIVICDNCIKKINDSIKRNMKKRK